MLALARERILVGAKLLGTEKSLLVAPMAGGITTPDFITSAIRAGAVGSLATGYLSADQVKSKIHLIQSLTSEKFSAGIFVPNSYNLAVAQNHITRTRELLLPLYKQLGLTFP